MPMYKICTSSASEQSQDLTITLFMSDIESYKNIIFEKQKIIIIYSIIIFIMSQNDY
jgi:hypothetical protein